MEQPDYPSFEEFEKVWDENKKEIFIFEEMCSRILNVENETVERLLKPMWKYYVGYAMGILIFPLIFGLEMMSIWYSLGLGMLGGATYSHLRVIHKHCLLTCKQMFVSHLMNQKIAEQENERRSKAKDNPYQPAKS